MLREVLQETRLQRPVEIREHSIEMQLARRLQLPPVFNERPTSVTGVSHACVGPIHNHQGSLYCSEDGCMTRSHLKRACSGFIRFASEDWSCPTHIVFSLPPTRTITGRAVSTLSQSQESQPTDKRTCKECKKTIARNATEVGCPHCDSTFHKSCVVRQGFTRDQAELLAAGEDWSCSKCSVTQQHPSPNPEYMVERSEKNTAISKDSLRILQWNADSIKLKVGEMSERMKKIDVGIALVQESKLREKDKTPSIRGTVL